MKFIKPELDFESTLMRTVVVPGDFSLGFLHLVIQDVVDYPDPEDCEGIGPMAIKDCRGFGGMAKIIKIAMPGIKRVEDRSRD